MAVPVGGHTSFSGFEERKSVSFWEYTKDISFVNRFLFPMPNPPAYNAYSYPDELIFVPTRFRLMQNYLDFYGRSFLPSTDPIRDKQGNLRSSSTIAKLTGRFTRNSHGIGEVKKGAAASAGSPSSSKADGSSASRVKKAETTEGSSSMKTKKKKSMKHKSSKLSERIESRSMFYYNYTQHSNGLAQPEIPDEVTGKPRGRPEWVDWLSESDMRVMQHDRGFECDSDAIPCLFIPRKHRLGHPTHLLLYCHGNAEDLGKVYPILDYLRMKLPVSILAPDFPGYGIAPGEPNENSVIRTIRSVYEFVVSPLGLNVPSNRVIIYAFSIGTGGSLGALSGIEDISPVISGLAYEPLYRRKVEDLLDERCENKYKMEKERRRMAEIEKRRLLRERERRIKGKRRSLEGRSETTPMTVSDPRALPRSQTVPMRQRRLSDKQQWLFDDGSGASGRGVSESDLRRREEHMAAVTDMVLSEVSRVSSSEDSDEDGSPAEAVISALGAKDASSTDDEFVDEVMSSIRAMDSSKMRQDDSASSLKPQNSRQRMIDEVFLVPDEDYVESILAESDRLEAEREKRRKREAKRLKGLERLKKRGYDVSDLDKAATAKRSRRKRRRWRRRAAERRVDAAASATLASAAPTAPSTMSVASSSSTVPSAADDSSAMGAAGSSSYGSVFYSWFGVPNTVSSVSTTSVDVRPTMPVSHTAALATGSHSSLSDRDIVYHSDAEDDLGYSSSSSESSSFADYSGISSHNLSSEALRKGMCYFAADASTPTDHGSTSAMVSSVDSTTSAAVRDTSPTLMTSSSIMDMATYLSGTVGTRPFAPSGSSSADRSFRASDPLKDPFALLPLRKLLDLLEKAEITVPKHSSHSDLIKLARKHQLIPSLKTCRDSNTVCKYGLLVLVCPFTSIVNVITDKAGTWASYLMSERFNNLERLRDAAHSPLLIIHGKEDSIIPYSHSEKLYLKATNELDIKCELKILDGCDHNTMDLKRICTLIKVYFHWQFESANKKDTMRRFIHDSTQPPRSRDGSGSGMISMSDGRRRDHSPSRGGPLDRIRSDSRRSSTARLKSLGLISHEDEQDYYYAPLKAAASSAGSASVSGSSPRSMAASSSLSDRDGSAASSPSTDDGLRSDSDSISTQSRKKKKPERRWYENGPNWSNSDIGAIRIPAYCWLKPEQPEVLPPATVDSGVVMSSSSATVSSVAPSDSSHVSRVQTEKDVKPVTEKRQRRGSKSSIVKRLGPESVVGRPELAFEENGGGGAQGLQRSDSSREIARAISQVMRDKDY